MTQKDMLEIAPEQHTGKEVEAMASVQLNDNAEATAFYNTVKDRLLTVNKWHDTAGIISAKFQVVDAGGHEVNRPVTKDDFLKIDIPGPGSKEGDGYDWVCVQELKEINEENMQSMGFRVTPSHNPLGNKNETAHFYSDEASSSFLVTREGSVVTVRIVDRNIKPNDDSHSLTDKIRHTTVGIGALSIFSKLQWQKLADGLVKK